MRILDLFSGAGGCSVGYARAGFEVVGVDIEAHPDYPYELIVADALTVLTWSEWLEQFDAIHASPPCQGFTTMSNRHRGKGGKADSHPDLIAMTRAGLEAAGVPYVLENVVGAKRALRDPITLHGGHFGLQVWRPRLFESNLPISPPPPAPRPVNPIGVYGKAHDGRRLWTRADGTSQRAASSLEEGQRAMGIDWMQWADLTEAIPPQYTAFIGHQLMAYLRKVAA